MGGISFTDWIDAVDAKTGFKQLVETATFSYGHDPYNGTISTCSMGELVKSFSGKADNNKKAIERYLYQNDQQFVKYKANYIDCGIVGYVEYALCSTVQNRGTAKHGYRLMYSDNRLPVNTAAQASLLHYLNQTVYSTKAEAMLGLKQVIESGLYGFDTQYYITAAACANLIYAQSKWTEVRRSNRVLKTPKKQGGVIKPIHRYVFFGIAAM